jgi:hypothetical protein
MELTFGQSYNELVKSTIESGIKVQSRFGDTHEQIGGRITFPAGYLVQRRRMNYTIGWMELLQLLAGKYDAFSIERAAPRAKLSLFTPSMAYGPRVAPQIPRILDALTNDPQSRQAIVFVGTKEDGPTNDQPCTTSIQFLIRGAAVHSIVSMRSWDLAKGLPYDVFMFGGLTLVMSHILNYKNGSVTVTAGSCHVYDEDQPIAHASSGTARFRFDFHVPGTWEGVQNWAAKQVAVLQPSQCPAGVRFTRVRDMKGSIAC